VLDGIEPVDAVDLVRAERAAIVADGAVGIARAASLNLAERVEDSARVRAGGRWHDESGDEEGGDHSSTSSRITRSVRSTIIG